MKKVMMMVTMVCLSVGMIAGCSGTGKTAEEVSTGAPKSEGAAEAGRMEGASEKEKAEITAGEGKAEDTTEEGEAEGALEKGKAEDTAGEGKVENTPDVERTEEILIAAAASLKNAYENELIPMFQEKYPQITVKGTYDSSGKLQSQIEEGLEADIFTSAAQKQMNALDEEGLIVSETIVNLLENKIVLIVPSGNEEGFSEFTDIEKAESVALGDPASVPAGQYAQEALTNLGLWDTVSGKASLGTNVTEVLNQIAEASAEAGIVYATDAASMPDKVSVVAEAPEGSLEQKVIYPAAVVSNTAHREAAELFMEFLSSPEAMEVFISYGFSEGN